MEINKIFYQIQKMGIRDFMKNTVLRMDLLSSAPTLRARKEPQYQTVVGGILSLLIMGAFGYMLYLQLVTMMNKLSITYSQGMSDDISSDSSITDIQMAVSIEGVDLSLTPRKFIFELKQESIIVNPTTGLPLKTTSTIMLSPCQLSDWSSLGTNFKKQYAVFEFQKMLCIQSGQVPQLAGYAGSSTYKYLKFQIKPCSVATDPQCDTSSNVNTYMTNYLTTNDYFKAKFFLVDTIVTPTNQNAVVKFLQKNIFMAFTKTTGTVGFINMAQCTLETDRSLLPFQQIQSTSSAFIQDFYTNTVSISSSKYIEINLYKSTKAVTVTRTIGKLDVVLSYVGGLFSLIFTIIAFFIASYSEMKYEIYVAQSMLTNEEGKRLTEDDFGFATYLMYAVYDWLDTFGIAPAYMNRMAKIHEIRQQVCEQLDPVVIMKRLRYLQESNRALMKQQKLIALYMTKSMTIQESKKMRSILLFTDNVFDEIYANKEDNQYFQASENPSITDGDIIKNTQNLATEVKQEEPAQLSQEQEQQMLKQLILDSMLELQKDKSQISEKIKGRITNKTRERLIELCKKKSIQSGSIKADIYPIMNDFDQKKEDSELALNMAKHQDQGKLGAKQKNKKNIVIRKSKF